MVEHLMRLPLRRRVIFPSFDPVRPCTGGDCFVGRGPIVFGSNARIAGFFSPFAPVRVLAGRAVERYAAVA